MGGGGGGVGRGQGLNRDRLLEWVGGLDFDLLAAGCGRRPSRWECDGRRDHVAWRTRPRTPTRLSEYGQ